MQLLVSVRSAAEVGPALEGGADIIDARSRPSFSGPVSPSRLAEYLPGPSRMSLTLRWGTWPTREVIRAITSRDLPRDGADLSKARLCRRAPPRIATSTLCGRWLWPNGGAALS